MVRQLLTESLLLSCIGGAFGVLLAYWVLDVIVSSNLPLPLPVGRDVSIDARVLAFTAVVTIITGVLFGLAPAVQASNPEVVPVLKNEVVPSAGGRRGWLGMLTLRQGLVVSQVALSLISLVAAGLFLRSLNDAQRIDTGFETRGVLVMTVNLGREGYTPAKGQIFFEQAVEKVSALPGVRHAAIAQGAPLTGGISRSVFPEGADTTTRDRILVQVNSVGPGYFETIGIPLLRGRDFTRDDAEGAPRVVIVNKTMAERFWPTEDAIGRRFKFFGDDQYTTVIAVAKDSKYNGVAEEPIPYIYQPIRQNYAPAATLHVRADTDAAGLAGAVRGAIQQIDPTLSVFNVRTLEEQVSQSLAPLRMNVIVLVTFGALALLLAAIGLYGVANYSVTQRTREIGVRMALGATPGNVLTLVLGHGLILVAVGVVLGLAVSFAAASLLPGGLLPNVSTRDPLTFGGTAVLLGSVAMIASYLPARRATRIDPLIALRTE